MSVSLKSYNTFGVDVLADHFVSIVEDSSISDWRNQNRDSDYIILGGGSNLLFLENTSVPILKNELRGIEILEDLEKEVVIEVASGENWHDLVTWTVEQGFGGLENLALIPGSVGAAPVQNIGAYGVELKDRMLDLSYFNMETLRNCKLDNADCRFAYRDSIFKKELKGKAFITKVRFRLTKVNHQLNLSYKGLTQKLKEHAVEAPGIQDVYHAVIAIRQEKLPDPSLLGNAGSYFKNPVVPVSILERIKLSHPEVPHYPASDGKVKLAAGWLIDKAGWKGKTIGQVGTYAKQALVIVNHGGATGKEIYEFGIRIKSAVYARFGISLEEEVNAVK